jgi:hypothetical protein
MLVAGLSIRLASGLAVALLFTSCVTGCGTPGAPLPPSLNLPDTVNDLAATRTGDQVALTWKMPRKNTDKLLLKGTITVHICRKEGGGACVPVPANLLLAPSTAGSFTGLLPQTLATGAPRSLSYFVELVNRNGRSAGLSNAAVVLAGEAPPPVSGLTANVIKAGVVLHWNPAPQESTLTAVRLHRKLLTPPAAKPKSDQGPIGPAPEPVDQSLLVEPDGQAGRAQDRALDKDIRFGETYEYRAQRVARITVGEHTLQLAGPLSAPVRVEAIDVFPPAIPTGLAAVAALGQATLGQPGAETAIDLSWQPVTDTDLAGYAVYRREGDAAWQRISPAQPIIPPGFHDANVLPGHTYRYAVSAIDQAGHESARSVETEETVPNP